MIEKKGFDFEKFESLRGLELGEFCLNKETLQTIDSKFLEYFKDKRGCMDDLHLEYSLFLLEQVKMKEAYALVANYIDHLNISVRMTAIRFLTQWLNNYDIDDSVLNDPTIISKVKNTLKEHNDLMGVKELNHIIEKKQSRNIN